VIEARSARFLVAFLGVIALAVAGFVLMELRALVLPLVLALFLSVASRPMVRILRARRIPYALIVMVILLGYAVVFGAISYGLVVGAGEVLAAAPDIQAGIAGAETSARAWILDLVTRLHLPLSAEDLGGLVKLSSVVEVALSWVGTALTVTQDLLLTLLYLVFLLSGSPDFADKMARAFPKEVASRLAHATRKIESQIQRYLRTKTLISLLQGIVATGVLLAFGVNFAALFGILTFFFNYIPNVGALIAVVGPAVVIALQFGSLGKALLVVAILVVLHNLIGNVLEPKLLGASLDLSPLAVLLSLIFWGWLWGVWGMIISVPLLSILKIVCENVDELKPVAILMGGKA